ncbi:MAG: hypothetical protein WAQ25_01795 [Candidatus Saccharimonas sp.]
MSATPSVSPLLQYDGMPIAIAALLAVAIILWFGVVFYMTRKKAPKKLAVKSPDMLPVVDLSGLRQKYLQQIQSVEDSYRGKHINARALHQSLSLLLREFVSEVERMPLTTMTLTELKQSRHKKLAPTIEEYYKPEFATVESGNVDASLTAARKVVTEWS